MLANKKIKIYFLYLSLFFLALLFNINPSGGAKQDYQLFQEVIKIFSANVDLKYAKFFLIVIIIRQFFIFSQVYYKRYLIILKYLE